MGSSLLHTTFYFMNIYAALALLSCFSFSLIGWFVLYLNKTKFLNQIFFLYTLVAGIYCFAEFGYLQADSYKTAHFWLKVRSVWPITLALALHFHLLFTEKYKWVNSYLFTSLIYIPGIFLFIVDLGSYQITGIPILIGEIWTYSTPDESILHHFSGVYALAYILFMLGLTSHYLLTRSDATKKSQAKYVLVADILVVVIIFLNTFLINSPPFQHLHINSVLALANNFVIVYAIWKFNLLKLTPKLAAAEIISTMSNFLILISPDRRIDTVNLATLELTGYSQDELENQPLSRLFDYTEEFNRIIKPSEHRKNPTLLKNKKGIIYTKSGKKVPILYSLSIVKVKGGKENGYVFLGNELTELKQVEEKLKGNTQRLEDSNKSLNELFQIVSHDLNDSARLINTFSQLLKKNLKGYESAKADDYLDFIDQESKKLHNKINSLIKYEEIDTKSKFDKNDFNIILNSSLSALNQEIQLSNALITYDDLPTLETNYFQMKVLFKNLISNAIRFSGQSDPNIHIGAKQNDADSWTFSVEDKGIGISPEYFNKIFNVFEKLHVLNQYPGVGIGLAICKKIIKNHQGRIWVESQVGKGSTFLFTIPVEKKELTHLS